MSGRLYVLLMLGVSTLLTACASNHVANSEQIEMRAMEQAGNADITPKDAIQHASEAYEKAIADELLFYAPSHMENAKAKLSQAIKTNHTAKAPEDEVEALSAAFAASKLVADAYTNRENVETHLSKVLEHREVLLEVQSDNVHPKLFRKAVNQLEGLIRDIEGGQLAKAKDKEASVLAYYAKVEIETMKTQHLSKAVEKLGEAESIGADENAQLTFEKAEEAVDYANNFIEANYRDRDGIKRVCHKALVAAKHAYYVAEESARLVEIGEKEAEQYVLYIGSLLQRVNENVGIADFQALPLREQARELAEAFKIEARKRETLSERELNEVDAVTEEENQAIM